MTEAGYFQSRTISPSAIAIVVALHAGLIATVMLARVQATMAIKPGPIILKSYPLPKDPPPVRKTPKPPIPQQPQHESRIDQIPPIVDMARPTNPPIDPGPPIVNPPETTRAGTSDIPLPQPPTIERAASAKGDVRALITADDYPSSAVRNEETGSLRAKLMIAANGRVADCSIVQSSGSQALDNATCKILRSRARFTPALDSNGLPTAGSYVTPTITWQLQG